MNGNDGVARSNMISVSDFAAENWAFSNNQQICPNITSSRGEITLSFVNDVTVCCDTSESLVPFAERLGAYLSALCRTILLFFKACRGIMKKNGFQNTLNYGILYHRY